MTLVTFSRGLCFSAVLQVYFFSFMVNVPLPDSENFLVSCVGFGYVNYIALFIVLSSFYSFELLDLKQKFWEGSVK